MTTTMNVEYNVAVAADINGILEVDYECFDSPWDKTHYTKYTQTSSVLYAKYKGKIIAFIVYETKAGKANIHKVAVLPKYQRKGIGCELVGFVIGNPLHTRVYTYVDELDLPSQLFFKACGLKWEKTLEGEKVLYKMGINVTH